MRHDASPAPWGKWTPHITKVVKMGRKGLHFPLKKKYDSVNTILEGAELAQEEFDGWKDLLDVTSPEDKVEGPDELRGVQVKEEEEQAEHDDALQESVGSDTAKGLLIWSQSNDKAGRFRMVVGNGPTWQMIVRRVTKDRDTNEIIQDWDCLANPLQSPQQKLPGGPRNTEI